MNSISSEAGARIRQLRKINRLTRERLAEIAEISPKFLYEIETGHKRFSVDTLYKLSKGLSVNCEYILSGDDQKEYDHELTNALQLFDAAQTKDVVKLLMIIYELSIKFKSESNT